MNILFYSKTIDSRYTHADKDRNITQRSKYIYESSDLGRLGI